MTQLYILLPRTIFTLCNNNNRKRVTYGYAVSDKECANNSKFGEFLVRIGLHTVSETMKDYSSFLTEKPFSCNVDGCSMKFTNEDHLTVHRKRHDMILNLGLGQKASTFTDQTPTPTQFIRNCEEVGLFQDLQNVNPFEETFKKAVEAVKTGQLSLEKSFQSTQPDDTLHTPNIFPHITDVPNISAPYTCNKTTNAPPSKDELLKEDISGSEKNCSADIIMGQPAIHPCLDQTNRETAEANKFPGENRVILNLSEGHLVQLLPPDDSPSSCNMLVIKNSAQELLTPTPPNYVKEKLKQNLNEKKNGKKMEQKVPILKCPVKKPSGSLNKFSKFSKNALKLISKLENTGGSELSKCTSTKPKKVNKVQSKESRSEFLARSRAASSRCREKKKMYLLYLEKVNSELSAANQNLMLMNSLLRQEINDLKRELLKHKNCNATDKNAETELTVTPNFTEIKNSQKLTTQSTPKNSKIPTVSPPPKEVNPSYVNDTIPEDSPGHQSDPTVFSFDVAEVILSDKPEESEIPLNEDSKPPDIIVRFSSVGNDFPPTLPVDSQLDRYIEKAGNKVKQIYSEHSYYLKKSSVDTDKRFVGFETLGGSLETPITPEECRKLNAVKIQMKQNDAFRSLTSLNSRVLLGQRTPPPLILLKPFKKRSLQTKRNEKT